jgi:ABC-type multidrug transport system fused ATPase/permease subunit
VEKYFGKAKVDPAKKKAAKDLSSKIATEGQQKFWRLLKLAIPVLPMYCVSLVLRAIKDGALEAQFSLMLAEIADLALQPNGRQLIRAASVKILVFFGYRSLMGILGDVMANRSNSGFLLMLRRTFYTHMLRQDIAYFDKKQASVLQEQLNSDTRQIAQVCCSSVRFLPREAKDSNRKGREPHVLDYCLNKPTAAYALIIQYKINILRIA